MTTSEYEDFVRSKVNTPLECSYLGLAGETGELLDLLKKVTYHGHKLEHDKFINECGDILFYLTDILNRHQFNIQDAMFANVEKLNRRYKAAFTKEESQNRKE